MSDPYLLAAGLLTLTPSASNLPPEVPPDLSLNFDGKVVNNANTTVAVKVSEPVTTNSVDNPYPEASRQIAARTLPQTTAWYQDTLKRPVSGTQLYYQRLAALQVGKLFTRLDASSFAGIWSKATSKPSYQQWKQLLAQEAKVVAKGQGNNHLNILLGDSLSLWFPSEMLPGGKLWLNQGISGENSEQVLSRIGNFAQTRPDNIYLLAGVNDLRQGKSDATILNNTRLILRRLRQNHPQAKIVVQSILPTRLSEIPDSRIITLNRQILAIAQQEDANYLDLHRIFTDTNQQMRKDLTTDGLHLSRKGYVVWQAALQQAEYYLSSR